MIRRRDGNAVKNTVRCPQCGFENLRRRDPPGERTVHFTCRRCGFPILTTFGRRYLAEHPQEAAAFAQQQARVAARIGRSGWGGIWG